MKIIQVGNLKGGVGKTTISCLLAEYAIERGHRVLLIDFDPHGKIADRLVAGHPSSDSAELLLAESTTPIHIDPSRWNNLSIVASGNRLQTIDRTLGSVPGAACKLANWLKRNRDRWDMVIIDSSPSLSLPTLNGIGAADLFVVPTTASDMVFQNTTSYLTLIGQFDQRLGRNRPVLTVTTDMGKASEINEYRELSELIIPFDQRVSDAIAAGIPTALYCRNSPVREQLAALWSMIEHQISRSSADLSYTSQRA